MKPKDIKIETKLNGWVVTVGCSEVVFESRKKMLKELGRYLKDPAKVELEYVAARTEGMSALEASGIGWYYTSGEEASVGIGIGGSLGVSSVDEQFGQTGITLLRYTGGADN